jgi:hypothetical protein
MSHDQLKCDPEALKVQSLWAASTHTPQPVVWQRTREYVSSHVPSRDGIRMHSYQNHYCSDCRRRSRAWYEAYCVIRIRNHAANQQPLTSSQQPAANRDGT